MAESPTRPPTRLRVLVIDDSSICRASLAAALEADGDIEVVGEGEDGFGALGLVQSLRPDVVTMDIQMPGKSGLEAVEQIMARAPVPILVVTAMPLGDEDHNNVAFTAIENGALDIIAKPSLTDDAAGEDLRSRIRSLSRIPVFQRYERTGTTTTAPPSGQRFDLIAVTSGQGGIASVISFVTRLPSAVAAPVILYEVLPPQLVASYTQHLARISKIPVVVADGATATATSGKLLVVPGSRATCTAPNQLELDPGGPASADHFFRSLSSVYGSRALGIVLGGAGTDGAEGLAAIRAAGGMTLVEAPAAGSGGQMPRAALAAVPGAESGSCAELAEKLTKWSTPVFRL